MGQRLKAVLLSGSLILLLGCTGAAGGNSAAAGSERCAAISYGAITQCYPPSRRLQAKQEFTVRPIDPSSIVVRVTGLHLTRVVVYRLTVPPHTPTGIEYDYGHFPARWHGVIPRPVPSRPRIAIVSETAPAHITGPWQLERTTGHDAQGRVRHDPWHFYAHQLDVGGSIPRWQVKEIGVRVLAKG